MLRIDFNKTENVYEPTELVRMFLKDSEYEIAGAEKVEPRRYFSTKEETDAWKREIERRANEPRILLTVPDALTQKDEVKRWLYKTLSERTGKTMDWGILTGVRPVKLYGELRKRYGTADSVREVLTNDYYLAQNKIDLLQETYEVQKETMTAPDGRSIALYLGIPFCPTRCLYCSFTSNRLIPEELDRYLEALAREIRYCGKETRGRFSIESVYIGGGTPTTLSKEQLTWLLREIYDAFDLSASREFTVESGRPDTITADKIRAILVGGGDRISINPQTMKQETLDRIGRAHTAEDIRTAFRYANQVRREENGRKLIINTDLITGLPGETPEDFEQTLSEVLAFDPENITVHTLAVKRGSRLHEEDKDFSYQQGETTRKMLNTSWDLLRKAGYRPYYLYRQKQMSGNFENVGYAKPGTENLYNMKIMEENQSILALGAGGISKLWYPKKNLLERVPNVTNYQVYCERIVEMLERKAKGFFAHAEELKCE